MTPVVRVLRFTELDPRTAYDLWRLRQQVFVVEQECPYDDLDGRDTEPDARHVVVTVDGAVVGGLRLLAEPDGSVRLGRVVLAPEVRGLGLADELMRVALAEAGDRTVVLGGQTPLAGWYARFGFEQSGPEYLEDGIGHVPMRRSGECPR